MNMYYIAHLLPQELNRKIQVYKEDMYHKYGCKVGLKSPAHITFISPFYMELSLEQPLVNELHSFCQEQHSFEVQTNNFSAFKPRTIFIDVVVSKLLLALKANIDAYFESNNQFPLKLDKRPFHPHITIATRDFNRTVFLEAFPLFEDISFQEFWKLDSLTLLKLNQQKWDVLYTSHFSS